MRSSWLAVAALVAPSLAGCEPAPPPSSEPPRAPVNATAEAIAAPSGPWDAELLAIASTYARFGVIAEKPNWAPTLCAAPTTSAPSADTPRISEPEADGAHGEKLYFLYARDRAAYVKLASGGGDIAEGQVIVKEAFAPVEVRDDSLVNKKLARKGSHAFKAGERIALFVMKKVARWTPNTDEGWIYAVVDGEGKHVKASGKLELCVRCHVNAPHDRLFAKDI